MRASNVFIVVASLCVWVTVGSTPMMADSILQFGGTETVGAVSTNFGCNLPGDSTCASSGGGKGDFSVTGSTGVFAQYNGTFGLIGDTNNALQPLNTLFSLPGFLTFDLNNSLTIELTFLPLGTDSSSSNCSGLAHCTPQSNLLITPNNPLGLSGFDLDQTISGTLATSQVLGIIHLSDGTNVPISGDFTVEFLGLDPQQALALMMSGSSLTYQANLTSTISATTVTPEPSSIVMTGPALIVLAGIVVTRNARARSCRATSN
jgi:hypothetical protein